MLIQAKTKFSHGDHVMYSTGTPCRWTEGRISDIRLYKQEHCRSDAVRVAYQLEPVALTGLEHDDWEWVVEDEVKPVK